MERREKLVLGLTLGGCALTLAALVLTGPSHAPRAGSPGKVQRELPRIAAVADGEALDLGPYVAQGKTLVEFTAEW